ncbi:MAG: adenylate/guanylate cyclase domain-containing protein [Nitrospinales bacterium]
MLCPKCQFDNADGMNFCGKCGTKLERFCPQCNFANQCEYEFCGKCGNSLSFSSGTASKELSFDDKLAKIQKYLPKGLTGKILSQRDKIQGERKQVSVMFCDMEGFTPLTEKLGPDDAYAIMDQIYKILIHKVHEFEGTVNEMTGDGIMALYGAPIALEDAPQRAIRSSLSIHREMAKFNEKLKQEKYNIPPLKMRVGVHTGPVVVGTLGNDLRVEFKAVGDTVNIASRMEGIAEPGTTYISEDTFKLTEGFFRVEALGERQIKGKKEPIKVYRVIAPSTRKTRFDVSAERGLTPFLGRNREFELLIDSFERCKNYKGQAISIVSEAGLGKSRLLYEFRKAVACENVTFLEGKCLSYSTNTAYHPFIDILKSNFNIIDDDTDLEIIEKVKQGLKILGINESSTLPYVLDLLSAKDSGIDKTILSPEKIKVRILESLKRILLKIAEMRTLVIAVEDLHWIDKSSEEALKQFLDTIPGARVFLIFTYRPEYFHTWGHRSYHSQVNLNRLSSRECLSMVTHLLDAAEIDIDLQELIIEKTEGVPFFVEEFVKSLKDLKIINKKNQKYSLVKYVQNVVIPSTIQDVIMARVDSLPEESKHLLQIGSVAGREFNHDLIRRITELPDEDLLSYLSTLKESELIYESGIYPGSTFIFKHALTQEVAYNSLLIKKRKEIHEKIGKVIEVLYSERLEECYEILAHHYALSEDQEKAYRYLKLSGDKAYLFHANWEAYRYYREAIVLCNHLPQTESVKRKGVEARFCLFSPAMVLGFPEDALQFFIEGADESRKLGESRRAAEFEARLASVYATKGKLILAAQHGEQCFEEAERFADLDLMAEAARNLCFAYTFHGAFRKVLILTSKVISLIEKENKHEIYGRSGSSHGRLSVWAGVALGYLGRFGEGIASCEKARRAATKYSNTAGIGFSEMIMGIISNVKGDGNAAVEHLKRAREIYERSNATVNLGTTWANQGYALMLQGDPESGQEHAQQGLDIAIKAGIPYYLPSIHTILGECNLRLRDTEKAFFHGKESLRLARLHQERHAEGQALMLLGRIHALFDSPESQHMESLLQKSMSIFKDLGTRPHYALAHLYLCQSYTEHGQTEKAREHLKTAADMFRKMGMGYWLELSQGAKKGL